MPRFVALLRGVNVAGHGTLKMAALQAAFETAGFERVQTYIQSGNVVFAAPKGQSAASSKTIEQWLNKDLGAAIPVLALSAQEMEKTIANNPFLGEPGLDPKALHATFLFSAPTDAALRKLDSLDTSPDRFRVVGTTVYLHCPQGYGRSKLSTATLERVLGVAATTRNWNTLLALCELAAE
jgi:uncharacterized protein (DUF1697 family)